MAQTPYIGSKISLISKLNIRYEGTLFGVDSLESTITLKNVVSFGTEDRNVNHHVPSRNEIYELIIFKANDIKDLIVCESPKPPELVYGGLHYDPAIISVSKPDDSVPSAPSPQMKPRETSLESDSDSSRATPTPVQNVSSQNTQQLRNQRTVREPQSGYQNRNYQHYPHNQQYREPQNYHQRQFQQRNYNPQQHSSAVSRNEQGQRNQDYHNQYRQNFYNNQHYQTQNRQTGGPSQRRPRNYDQNRPQIKFDSDFDFEKANAQFRTELSEIDDKIAGVTVEDNAENVHKSTPKLEIEKKESSKSKSPENDQPNSCYNKSMSFFDTISCEAMEKQDQQMRPNWKRERATNQETFGLSAFRSNQYRGFRGGFNYRGNRANTNRNYR